MRIVIALVFAVLATVGSLTAPLWLTPALDVVRGKPDLALPNRMVADLRAHNYDDLQRITVNPIGPGDLPKLDKVAATLPRAGEPQIVVVAWTKPSAIPGTDRLKRIVEAVYDYGAAGAVQTKAVIIEQGGIERIGTMILKPIAGSALHTNDFHWPTRWQSKRWLVLFAAVIADLVAFASFALCLTDSLIRWRWRWLWALLMLFGAVRFNLDWAAVDASISPLTLLVPPALFLRFATYGPWVLSVSIPVGAIVYWSQRQVWARGASGVAGARV